MSKPKIRNFYAWVSQGTLDPSSFIVIGQVETNAGYLVPKLKEAVPQGFNPRVLILDLTIENTGNAGDAAVLYRDTRYESEITLYNEVQIMYEGELLISLDVFTVRALSKISKNDSSERASISRVYGSAEYEAKWIGKSLLVELTATGILPCSNYVAQLEQRPERILPPMWDMVFYAPNFCEKAKKPFSESVVFVNNVGATSIFVVDENGEQEVPIK